MASVHIGFLEGFHGETAVVRLDGAEVYRKDGLRTRTQIGLASQFQLDSLAPGTEVELAFDLPDLGIDEKVRLQVGQEVFLGVSLSEDGRLLVRVGQEPFRFA